MSYDNDNYMTFIFKPYLIGMSYDNYMTFSFI